MFWDTDKSPAISVWYIAVVFVLTIVTPPIMWVTGGRTWPLLLMAGVDISLPVPHVLYMDRVARYFVFFSLGGAAADAGERWLHLVDRYVWVTLAFLALLLTWALAAFDSTPEAAAIVRLRRRLDARVARTGTATAPVSRVRVAHVGLHELRHIPPEHTFHRPDEGTALESHAVGRGLNFLVFFPLLQWQPAQLGPILIKRYVFRHMPPLDRMTD